MNKILLRVAFADDDTDDHLLFVTAMKSHYISPIIDCFLDSHDLLEFYTRRKHIPPHLFFLDKNMPGNTDYECLNRIATTELLSKIPVVIFSTSDSAAEKERALAMGASGFITKPTTFSETVQLLTESIHRLTRLDFLTKEFINTTVVRREGIPIQKK